MTAVLPPLDLAVSVTDASGSQYRWDSNDRFAGNRPQNLGFSTKRGEGFADGHVTLARRIDRDYVDLHLFDDVAFVGADGSVAYEGRVAAQPRSVQAAHSVSVQCAGWMAHAKDRPFTEIYVDRDISAWGPTSKTRQASLMASNYSVVAPEAVTDASGSPALRLPIQDSWVSPYRPIVEALYDAGPQNRVSTVWSEGQGTTNSGATFELYLLGGPTDTAPDITSSDLWAGSNTAAYTALASPRRCASFEYFLNTTPGGSAGEDFSLYLVRVAVYGDHGLSVSAVAPGGVMASDVIVNVAQRFCPRLDTSGVQTTTWPIPHLVFKDQTDPYDAFLAVNAFHLWELGVWDNKTLTFAPSDRTDYDWDVRLGDFGVNIDLQGDSTESLANGIVVDFMNVQTGSKDMLTPNLYSELADGDPDNPVNTHGLSRWTKISLSSPTTTDAALQIGRTALAEFNQPKAPGTIGIVGHVRDRAGHWQQGWKVRAGDTIAITDHPNDIPRLITETNWDHEQKQLTITVDSTSQRLDAVLDRVGTALTAAGLG